MSEHVLRCLLQFAPGEDYLSPYATVSLLVRSLCLHAAKLAYSLYQDTICTDETQAASAAPSEELA